MEGPALWAAGQQQGSRRGRPHALPTPPALHLQQQPESFPAQHQRLSLGCPVLDGLLRGGLPLDGITELAGCSSAGKTQLALQLCLAVQLPRRYGGLEAGEWPPPGATLGRRGPAQPAAAPALSGAAFPRVGRSAPLSPGSLQPLSRGEQVSLGARVGAAPARPVCTPRQSPAESHGPALPPHEPTEHLVRRAGVQAEGR